MKSFNLLPHTADVIIRAKGSTYGELFQAALEGLCEVLKPGYATNIAFNVTENVVIESVDMTALLIDFLSEALYLMNRNKAIMFSSSFSGIGDADIEGILSGYHIDEFDDDVKAVTYHGAEIIEAEGKYVCDIVLDI